MRLGLGLVIAPFRAIAGLAGRIAGSKRGRMVAFGGLLVASLGAAGGVAVDYYHASVARAQLQAALTNSAMYAASLAVADAKTSNDHLTAASVGVAQSRFQTTDKAPITDFAVEDDGHAITAKASTVIKTRFMKFVGVDTMPVSSSSTIEKSGTNLEVALVLDTSKLMFADRPKFEPPVPLPASASEHGGGHDSKKEAAAEGHDAKPEAEHAAASEEHGASGSEKHEENAADAVATNTEKPQLAPIDAMKAALKTFVATVLPEEQGASSTKLAFIPFGAGVNLGTAELADAARGPVIPGESGVPGATQFTFATSPQLSAYSSDRILGTRCNNANSMRPCERTFTISTCVSERVGDEAYSDEPLTAHPAGRFYAPPNSDCGTPAMVPLSTDAHKLSITVDALTSMSSAAGQVGLAWGWYALSPNSGIWSGAARPAAYEALAENDLSQRVHKVMILVTNGAFNAASCNGVISGLDKENGKAGIPYYLSLPGSGSPADHIGCAASNGDSFEQSAKLCASIKRSGIEIFVMAYRLDRDVKQRLALARVCASDADHLIMTDEQNLESDFQALGARLMEMRVEHEPHLRLASSVEGQIDHQASPEKKPEAHEAAPLVKH